MAGWAHCWVLREQAEAGSLGSPGDRLGGPRPVVGGLAGGEGGCMRVRRVRMNRFLVGLRVMRGVSQGVGAGEDGDRS